MEGMQQFRSELLKIFLVPPRGFRRRIEIDGRQWEEFRNCLQLLDARHSADRRRRARHELRKGVRLLHNAERRAVRALIVSLAVFALYSPRVRANSNGRGFAIADARPDLALSSTTAKLIARSYGWAHCERPRTTSLKRRVECRPSNSGSHVRNVRSIDRSA